MPSSSELQKMAKMKQKRISHCLKNEHASKIPRAEAAFQDLL
jgi:hypothetical protein